ncbi:MAG: hypothetical protein R3C31_03895 [Hyphomonadaceae bacterium]
MQHHWFKPKRYGLGAYPASWQGWALTAAYLVFVVCLSAWFGEDNSLIEHRVTPFLVITAAATIIYVGIAWRTTEGGWHWRWGGKDRS